MGLWRLGKYWSVSSVFSPVQLHHYSRSIIYLQISALEDRQFLEWMVQAVQLVVQARSFSFSTYNPGSGPGLGVSANSLHVLAMWGFVKIFLCVVTE